MRNRSGSDLNRRTKVKIERLSPDGSIEEQVQSDTSRPKAKPVILLAMLALIGIVVVGSLGVSRLIRSPTAISPESSPLSSGKIIGTSSTSVPIEINTGVTKTRINEFPSRTGFQLPAPSISAEAYLLVDLSSPSTILERNAHQTRPIASITKLVTAVVSLQLGDKQDVLQVSGNASMQPPTKMGLLKGDRVRLADLLAGLLLDSGNDAAKALEEGLGGRTEFVHKMNALAKDLGMTDTMFDNSAGFDSDRNFSTPYDLVLLSRHIIFNEPEIMDIVSSDKLSIESNDGHGWFGPQNMNRLITEYEGSIGLKTGETDAAGLSLLAAAKRKGTVMVAVVLSSDNHFADARRLLDYGFDQSQEEY